MSSVSLHTNNRGVIIMKTNVNDAWLLIRNSSKCHTAAVFVTSLLCYINSLAEFFIFDDVPAIAWNNDLRPTTPLSKLFENDFWGQPVSHKHSHGSYRPLCVLTFRLNFAFSELEPQPYHAVNIVLHALTSSLAYWCLRVLSFQPFTAWAAAMLFAVHPIHTEAVDTVVGRAELLSGIFFLLGIICYVYSARERDDPVKKHLLLAIALVSIPAAALSKESGLMVAGLFLFYELVICAQWKLNSPLRFLRHVAKGEAFLRLVTVIATTSVFLYLRLKLMQHIPAFSALDNPAAYSPTPIRQLTYAYLVPLNAKLLLYPWPLLYDYVMGTVPLISGWLDARNIVTLCFFTMLFIAIAIAVFHTQSEHHRLALCLALTAVPFIPASNLFLPVGFVIAERVLYLPSFGWCALVAVGFELLLERQHGKLKQTKRGFLYFALVLVVAAFFLRSYMRNFDWIDGRRLYRASIRFNPRNAKFFSDVGTTFDNDRDWDRAFTYYYKAARTFPADWSFHRNAARTLIKLRRFDLAERALLRADRATPDFEVVLYELGRFYFDTLQQPDKALPMFERVVQLSPNKIDAWGLLGNIHMDYRRDFAKAVKAFESLMDAAVHHSRPNDVGQGQFIVCQLFERQHSFRKAKSCFENLLQLFPIGSDHFVLKKLIDLYSQHSYS